MSIKITANPRLDVDELRPLIDLYRYGRYCEDRNLSLEAARRLVLDHVQEYLSKDDTRNLVCFSSGQILGALLFKLSKWDTDHFGYPVAIVDSVIVADADHDQKMEVANALLEQLDSWCGSNAIRFISVRASALDLALIHCLERRGFGYIESWIYNKFDLRQYNMPKMPPYPLRLANLDDAHKMIEYAKGAFATHRFHADPHIGVEKAEALYQKWILTTFADPNQQVLTLDVDGKPAAFMAYYKSDLRSYFGLQFAMWKMAVLDPAIRGKGLGTDFFQSLIYYHKKEGLDVIDSGLSMRNLTSLNLHNKLGFKVIASVVTLHKWLT